MAEGVGNDYFEEDEAIGEIVEIFEKGEKHLTGQDRGMTDRFTLAGDAVTATAVTSSTTTTEGAAKTIRLLT